MKKVSINLVGILLFATMLFACENSSNNTESNDDKDSSNTEVANNEGNEVEDVVSFSKFEHYATILTKTDLDAQFGEAFLTDATNSYAEGTVEKDVTILTNPDNGQIIKYVWGDDGNTTEWIEAQYNIYDENWEIIGTQKIEAENGLSLGMSLMELKDWNGADFKFSGFGWDYAGFIYEEEGSKISESPIQIALDLINYDGAEFTMGDVELNTNDSRLNKVDIIVTQFTMYIK